MARLDTLQDLLVDQLQNLYTAQNKITETLPKMISVSSSGDLKMAFDAHLQTTHLQLQRLDEVFQKLSINHNHHFCPGIDGLIKEGELVIDLQGDPAIKDAAIISTAQRIEHYEIALYSTARTFARELGYNDIAALLEDTLEEENNTEKQLTTLAKGGFFSSDLNQSS
jgi:ferritin-like metal-binding protein YciE